MGQAHPSQNLPRSTTPLPLFQTSLVGDRELGLQRTLKI